MVLHLINLNFLHPRMFCAKFGDLSCWFWRRRFINFVNVFLLLHYYHPLEKNVLFICANLNPPYPRYYVNFGY